MNFKRQIINSLVVTSLGFSFAASAEETEYTIPVKLTTGGKLTQAPVRTKEDVLNNASVLGQEKTPTEEMLEFMSFQKNAEANHDQLMNGSGSVVPIIPAKSNIIKKIENNYKPVQKLANIEPGSSIMVPVSQGLMNRIKTPFKMVAVRDSGNENTIVDLDEGMVFVTVNSFEPMSLMIYEEGVPESMFSIMLHPMEAPPVMIDVGLKLTPEMIAKRDKFHRDMEIEDKLLESDSMAKIQTQTSEYVRRIKEILTPVATGEIPRGFSFTEQIPSHQVSPCSVSIFQQAKQRLIGAREIVDVVLVKNDSSRIYSVREEHCISKDSIAVAVLDKSTLQPGEHTEIYILRDKLYEQRQKQVKRRPRLTQ